VLSSVSKYIRYQRVAKETGWRTASGTVKMLVCIQSARFLQSEAQGVTSKDDKTATQDIFCFMHNSTSLALVVGRETSVEAT
jgi:hypothetical protein